MFQNIASRMVNSLDLDELDQTALKFAVSSGPAVVAQHFNPSM